jgi:hypothetical protein
VFIEAIGLLFSFFLVSLSDLGMSIKCFIVVVSFPFYFLEKFEECWYYFFFKFNFISLELFSSPFIRST